MDGRTSRSVGDGGTDRLSKAEHYETVQPTHVPARLYSSDDDTMMTVTDLLKQGATINLLKKKSQFVSLFFIRIPVSFHWRGRESLSGQN